MAARAYRSTLSSLVPGLLRRGDPAAAVCLASVRLVLVAERQVDLDERLLLLLGDVGVGEDLAGQVVAALAGLEDARLDVERLGRDPQRPGDLLEDLRRGLAAAPARSG